MPSNTLASIVQGVRTELLLVIDAMAVLPDIE
jgi:hypothetical protein